LANLGLQLFLVALTPLSHQKPEPQSPSASHTQLPRVPSMLLHFPRAQAALT
jgi:hypothetical protein